LVLYILTKFGSINLLYYIAAIGTIIFFEKNSTETRFKSMEKTCTLYFLVLPYGYSKIKIVNFPRNSGFSDFLYPAPNKNGQKRV